MKNFNDSIRNLPRDLLACSAVLPLVILFSCYFYLTVEMKHMYIHVRAVKRNAVLLQAIHHFKTHSLPFSVIFQHRYDILQTHLQAAA
jgi:hypothetical protein